MKTNLKSMNSRKGRTAPCTTSLAECSTLANGLNALQVYNPACLESTLGIKILVALDVKRLTRVFAEDDRGK